LEVKGHGSRVGVEALASCPHILHHGPPLSTHALDTVTADA
jgi:hypothetical protein